MAIDEGLFRRLHSLPEGRIVAELKKIHARRTDGSEAPTVRSTPASSRGRETDYDRARRVFAGEEQRLRKHALLTEQVVEQLRNQEPGSERERSTQETLFLRAAAGRPAGGRFRLANRFARTLDIELHAKPLRHDGSEIDVPCPITVSPSETRLRPGEDCVVRVHIDLAAVEALLAPGATLEAEIVARGDGSCLHRLWIEVEIYAAPSPKGRP